MALLLDDVDSRHAALCEEVETLIRLAEQTGTGHSVLVATASQLPPIGLRSRFDLQTSLPPFSADETAGYVQSRLEAVAHPTRFSAAALLALHESTAGVPATINRVADLALISAFAADAAEVTATMVTTAAGDVTVSALRTPAANQSGHPQPRFVV